MKWDIAAHTIINESEKLLKIYENGEGIELLYDKNISLNQWFVVQ